MSSLNQEKIDEEFSFVMALINSSEDRRKSIDSIEVDDNNLELQYSMSPGDN